MEFKKNTAVDGCIQAGGIEVSTASFQNGVHGVKVKVNNAKVFEELDWGNMENDLRSKYLI